MSSRTAEATKEKQTNKKPKNLSVGMVAHPLITALQRHRQVAFFKFKAGLIYIEFSRTAKNTKCGSLNVLGPHNPTGCGTREVWLCWSDIDGRSVLLWGDRL